MPRRIVIVQGHPEPGADRLCHVLARAYADGARDAGHEVETIDVAALDVPILRSCADWEGEPPPDVASAQAAIARADHILLMYPLWLGAMPALLKAFLEQVMRPGFAIAREGGGGAAWRGMLAGKSARVVVTMGMPALVYRWYFGAHSLRSLERNILRFVGIRPVRHTLVGMVEGMSEERRTRLLARMRALGARAA